MDAAVTDTRKRWVFILVNILNIKLYFFWSYRFFSACLVFFQKSINVLDRIQGRLISFLRIKLKVFYEKGNCVSRTPTLALTLSSNRYLTTPTPNLYFTATALNLCLPVLRFKLKFVIVTGPTYINHSHKKRRLFVSYDYV